MKKIDPKSLAEESSALADQAADKVQDAIDATRNAAEDTLDAAGEGVDSLRAHISRRTNKAARELGRAVRAGRAHAADMRDSVQDRLSCAGECTVAYIREKPVQTVLLAALGGVLVAGLIGCVVRSSRARGR